jgi:hypothetical protein
MRISTAGFHCGEDGGAFYDNAQRETAAPADEIRKEDSRARVTESKTVPGGRSFGHRVMQY